MDCKEATLLIEQKAEKRLSPVLLLKLKVHQVMCKVCAYYETQSKLIAKALHQNQEVEDTEVLKSLKEKIMKRVIEDEKS
jgi:hypothetical protein